MNAVAPAHTFDFAARNSDGPADPIKIRVVTLEGEPWFVAADVCRALYPEADQTRGTTRFMRPVRIDEQRMLTRGLDTLDPCEGVSFGWGRASQLKLLSESSLYKLIMRSDKPQAREFQDWVTREVFPSIRKTGAYELPKGREMPARVYPTL